MHPALSIILFTTLSGAGYGLAAVTTGAALFGTPGQGARVAGIAIPIAFGFIVGGLVLSGFHLRRPARARFAFSQWRSSWLSREAVLSVLTLAPLGLFWASRLFLGLSWLAEAALAIATILGSVATVVATGMIYASLRPIPEWHDPRVVPVYLALGLQSGALLFLAISLTLGGAVVWPAALAGGAVLAAWLMKLDYWRAIDRRPDDCSRASALGLDEWRDVQPLDPAENGVTYVHQEMGFRIARKHSLKLRRLALILGCGLPLAGALSIPLLGLAGAAGIAVALFAAGSAFIGVLIERWLFFAEATHTAMLYY